MTATSLVALITPRDFVGGVLEVLRLLTLAHLAASAIMVVITILPVGDVAAALSVSSAMLLAILAE